MVAGAAAGAALLPDLPGRGKQDLELEAQDRQAILAALLSQA